MNSGSVISGGRRRCPTQSSVTQKIVEWMGMSRFRGVLDLIFQNNLPMTTMIIKLLNILRSHAYRMIINSKQYENLPHDPYDFSMLVQGVVRHKWFVTSSIDSSGTLSLWYKILLRWHRWLMISTKSYESSLLKYLERKSELKYNLRGTNTLRSALLIPGTKLILLIIDSSYLTKQTATLVLTIDENGLVVFPPSIYTDSQEPSK